MALDNMPSIIPTDAVGVFMFERDGVNLASRGVPEASISTYLKMSSGSDPLIRRMQATLQPVHEAHLFSQDEWHEQDFYQSVIGPHSFEHYLVTPLVGESSIVGALAFARKKNSSAFSASELMAAAMTTTYASVALAYSRRHEISTTESMSSLNSREAHISTLVAKGLSNREIGYQIRISENTVKKHLKCIFAKVGVSRRAELAWLATLAGLE